jgi:hypothetical protein
MKDKQGQASGWVAFDRDVHKQLQGFQGLAYYDVNIIHRVEVESSSESLSQWLAVLPTALHTPREAHLAVDRPPVVFTLLVSFAAAEVEDYSRTGNSIRF